MHAHGSGPMKGRAPVLGGSQLEVEGETKWKERHVLQLSASATSPLLASLLPHTLPAGFLSPLPTPQTRAQNLALTVLVCVFTRAAAFKVPCTCRSEMDPDLPEHTLSWGKDI